MIVYSMIWSEIINPVVFGAKVDVPIALVGGAFGAILSTINAGGTLSPRTRTRITFALVARALTKITVINQPVSA